MRIHLIKEKTIRDFTQRQAQSKISFTEWVAKLKLADWDWPGDIKKTFPTADLLGRSSFRVIFNIAGNQYRMICKYGFGETEIHLFVCWIGTHAAYDKLCREEKQYTISLY